MIIAIPINGGRLSQHFGHCEQFRLFHTDKDKNILSSEDLTPPPHEPGVLPQWLAEKGADVIITGGMGMQAQRLFMQHGIEVVLGAPAGDPVGVAEEWLNGTLESGANACDH